LCNVDFSLSYLTLYCHFADFVRNHGAVPNLSWDTHMLSVTGLVDKPTKFTMADLVTKFDQVTVSATLVCVGNRRKEQNLVKKTKGFSWGASAVGTGKYHHTCSDCTMTMPVKLHKPAWPSNWSCVNPCITPSGLAPWVLQL